MTQVKDWSRNVPTAEKRGYGDLEIASGSSCNLDSAIGENLLSVFCLLISVHRFSSAAPDIQIRAQPHADFQICLMTGRDLALAAEKRGIR